ncbi:MAG TPA: nucleotidyltransferase [Candidatus Latescibacteria bacterium]|nr:nucleotidyltransferase [Candidatus Latescibacterota bacterium]
MKALIIAAGGGTRLRPYTNNKPKALIPLLGVPLIVRIISSVKKAGIDQLTIVTGYLGSKLRHALGDGNRYGVKIQYIRNPEWWKPNGISVLKARPFVQENFLLLMSDHIFDPRILLDLLRLRIENKESILCVDRDIYNIFDISDATKVKVNRGKIKAIGKHLRDYNGIDTGLFMCSPHFFKVLEYNIKRGYYSLSDSVRTLARRGRMRAHELTNAFWFDIDTLEALRLAEERIRKLGLAAA